MKKLTLALALFAVVAIAGTASADEKNVTTLPITTIYGRPGRPSAALEVSRVKMTLPLAPLAGPSADSALAAGKKDPF